MKKLNRTCWWCSAKLMAVSHGVTTGGHWVHKCCLDEANASLRYLTAQPTSGAQMDAQIEDQLGSD